MIQSQQIRLFKVFGITVHLHWSWFLVAAYEMQRMSQRSSLGWAAAEYLALFGIVLLHEFGHALACRQVGGSANEIILWPLGGVAFVSPPQRPGATLWSIAAGPLVNVVLAIPLAAAFFFLDGDAFPALHNFVFRVFFINAGLLIFNILPIYPLDGGQILRSLLWFFMGPVRSLWIAALIGVVGASALVVLAYLNGSIWTAVIAIFIATQCWRGFKEAQRLKRLEAIPRHNAFSCPACNAHPMQAPIWLCGGCGQPFDPFLHDGVCPSCGRALSAATCPDCREAHSLQTWGVGR
ncbi:MAG: site-2 protease family protein [Chthoniobacteraceae bacterium]